MAMFDVGYGFPISSIDHLTTKFISHFVQHESRKSAEYNSQQDFYIYQPGSTVATSLCPGEVGKFGVGRNLANHICASIL